MTEQEAPQESQTKTFKARGQKTGLLNGNTPGVKSLIFDLISKHPAIDPIEATRATAAFYEVAEDEAERAIARAIAVLAREEKVKREGKLVKAGEKFEFLVALAAGWKAERECIAGAFKLSPLEAERAIMADRATATLLGQPGKLRQAQAEGKMPKPEPKAPATPASDAEKEAAAQERAAKRAAHRARVKGDEPDASALKAPPKRSKKPASEEELKAKAEALREQKKQKDAEAAAKLAEKKAKAAAKSAPQA